MQCDLQGRRIQTTDANGHTVSRSYAGGDLRTLTDAMGRTVSFNVDALGRVTSVSDALGNTVTRSYDSNGWLKLAQDARGQVTTFGYDNEGHITSVGLPNQTSITYAYDARYRVNQRNDALGQGEAWTYDVGGNLQTYTDRKGQETTYAARDALGRFAKVTFADGGTITADIYDAANRIKQVTDSAYGTVTRSYDDLDRLTGESSPQGAITYAYYANGLRKTMLPAGQAQVTYVYDDDNHIKSITQGSEVVGFSYDDAGRRQTLSLPNGIVATYAYDNANDLTSISYANASGTAVGDLSYGYDGAGRRISQSGSLASNQLTPATTPAGQLDASNRLTTFNGKTFTYDKNGNLTGDGLNTYVWNARNQLAQVQQNGVTIVQYAYDATGRRITKTINGVTTSLLYDNANVIQETQGATVNPMLTGLGVDEYFARNEGATRSYFLTDALGSTVGLTDTGATLFQRYQYDPYGNVTSTGSATNPYQYTGRENDGMGLYYYRARYYSPQLGRFISEDPIGFSGGQVNLYAYVDGRPLSMTDPTGLFGMGLSLGASAEGGSPFLGAAGQASIGRGYFSQQSGIGEYTSIGGGLFGGMFGSSQFPADEKGNTDGGSGKFAIGAGAGVSASVFMTNADAASDLSGPFDTWNFNFLFLTGSYAYDCSGHRFLSLGLSIGAGFSLSRYNTNTIETN